MPNYVLRLGGRQDQFIKGSYPFSLLRKDCFHVYLYVHFAFSESTLCSSEVLNPSEVRGGGCALRSQDEEGLEPR